MGAKRFGKPRASGEPSGSTERKIRILLELIRNKTVNIATLEDDYGIAERSLLRDFQELRNIGARAGFRIGEKVVNGRLRLESFDARPTALDQGGRKLYSLIKTAAKALGKPVEEEVASIAERDAGEEPFLHFFMPTLVDGGAITQTLRAVEDAWRANARVRFTYSGKERRVEPYAAIVRAGRYYLLGRDIDARTGGGWRHFALDRIDAPIARIGTFKPKEPPRDMLEPDAIGWMSGGKRTNVSVRISAALAAAAASRQWQREQQVKRSKDGSIVITLSTNDVDEVIRWALGFGAEARVVAPAAAVDRARTLTSTIAEAYRK